MMMQVTSVSVEWSFYETKQILYHNLSDENFIDHSALYFDDYIEGT